MMGKDCRHFTVRAVGIKLDGGGNTAGKARVRIQKRTHTVLLTAVTGQNNNAVFGQIFQFDTKLGHSLLRIAVGITAALSQGIGFINEKKCIVCKKFFH